MLFEVDSIYGPTVKYNKKAVWYRITTLNLHSVPKLGCRGEAFRHVESLERPI